MATPHHGVETLPRQVEASTSIWCCFCRAVSSDTFFKVLRRRDGLVHYNRQLCSLPLDVADFNRSPYICSDCDIENRRQQGIVSCNICHISHSIDRLRYSYSETNGRFYIGLHDCLISTAPVESARCCTACYARNARRLKKRKDAPSPQATVAPVLMPDSPDEQQLNVETVASPSTDLAPVVETEHPPPIQQSFGNDASEIVQSLIAIEEARAHTVAMITTVNSFLQQRLDASHALTGVINGEFSAEGFVSLQEYLLQVLQSQLETIKSDERQCAERLTHAMNESRR